MSRMFLGTVMLFGGILSTLLCGSRAEANDLLPPDKPIEAVIDYYINLKLKTDHLQPAPQTDDANLVRRLMLDLAGRIPAPVEAREFIDSSHVEKRTELVDRLISESEFADHMANQFDVMLMSDTGASLKDYLKVTFSENRRWDQVFRELLLPDQVPTETPEEEDDYLKVAAEFVKRRVSDTDKLTIDVSSIFFGVNVSCAQCHDHPEVGEWTQDNFYGMKSFFNRTFENGGFVSEREYGHVKFQTTSGEQRDAQLIFITGDVLEEPECVEPSKDEQKKQSELLKELAKKKEAPPQPAYSRRERLVEIALDPESNEFFSLAIVNRIWNQFIGYGLVMPLDQMHMENPSSHPELLQWLARDLVAHDYDLRRVVRGIVLSEAYSRSSRWGSEDRPFKSLFAVANVRPVSPLQYARSLSLATSDPEKFNGEMSPEERQEKISATANTSNSQEFQQPGPDFQISADEALFFSNSEKVAKAYLNGGLSKRLNGIESKDERIESAVWSVFTRPPTAEEKQLLSKFLETREDRIEESNGQLLWALLTSSEFRFNY